MSATACKFCGKPILWAKTPAGADMPLDADAETRWLIEGGANELVRARPVQVRTSHMRTCTNQQPKRS